MLQEFFIGAPIIPVACHGDDRRDWYDVGGADTLPKNPPRYPAACRRVGFIRQMMKRHLGAMPEADQEKLFPLVSAHPELFTRIATEVKEKMASGSDQMSAIMCVLEKYKDDVQNMFSSTTQ